MNKIELINGFVLIRPVDKESYKPASGTTILVKEESKWNNYVKGEVVRVSPYHYVEGVKHPVDIKVGDVVLYKRTITVPARDEVWFDGETLVIKEVKDIIGVMRIE